MHGLKVTILRNPYSVVECTLANGRDINPSAIYVGVLPDFLLRGGDGFKDAVGDLYEPRDSTKLGALRDMARS